MRNVLPAKTFASLEGATQTLVSIVTPSLNQAEFIEQTIVSVKDQDYPDIEHIVIDGGSTDGTIAILERYPHLRWISEPDDGQASAINKGFRMATGEIVAWLNSDDVYLPGAVGEAVRLFAGDPALGLVYGDYQEIDADGKVAKTVRTRDFDLDFELNVKNVIPQPSAFFRRSLFDSVGYLAERYHYAFDVEFWIRIAEAGVRIAHVPSVWSGFRRHASSKTVAEKGRFWREERHIRRDHGGKFFSRALYLHYAYPVYHPVYAATKRLRVLRPLVIRLRRFARKRRRFARY
jgi:glycosyltransferase involved in cell wall biosynthesis